MAAGASGSMSSPSPICRSWNSASSAAALPAASTAVAAVAGEGEADVWGWAS